MDNQEVENKSPRQNVTDASSHDPLVLQVRDLIEKRDKDPRLDVYEVKVCEKIVDFLYKAIFEPGELSEEDLRSFDVVCEAFYLLSGEEKFASFMLDLPNVLAFMLQGIMNRNSLFLGALTRMGTIPSIRSHLKDQSKVFTVLIEVITRQEPREVIQGVHCLRVLISDDASFVIENVKFVDTYAAMLARPESALRYAGLGALSELIYHEAVQERLRLNGGLARMIRLASARGHTQVFVYHLSKCLAGCVLADKNRLHMVNWGVVPVCRELLRHYPTHPETVSNLYTIIYYIMRDGLGINLVSDVIRALHVIETTEPKSSNVSVETCARLVQSFSSRQEVRVALARPSIVSSLLSHMRSGAVNLCSLFLELVHVSVQCNPEIAILLGVLPVLISILSSPVHGLAAKKKVADVVWTLCSCQMFHKREINSLVETLMTSAVRDLMLNHVLSVFVSLMNNGGDRWNRLFLRAGVVALAIETLFEHPDNESRRLARHIVSIQGKLTAETDLIHDQCHFGGPEGSATKLMCHLREMMDTHFMLVEHDVADARLKLAPGDDPSVFITKATRDLVVVRLSEVLLAVVWRPILENRCPKLVTQGFVSSEHTKNASVYTWRAFFQFAYSTSLSKDVIAKMNESHFRLLVRDFIHPTVADNDLLSPPIIRFPVTDGDLVIFPADVSTYSSHLETIGLKLYGEAPRKMLCGQHKKHPGVMVDQRMLKARSPHFSHLIDGRVITGDSQPISFRGNSLELFLILHYVYRGVDALVELLLMEGVNRLCFRVIQFADEFGMDDLRAAAEWSVLKALKKSRITSREVKLMMNRIPMDVSLPFLGRTFKRLRA
jgi:hypothetical protein